MHDYYPSYSEELENTNPITDLLVAVSLLSRDSETYLVLNNGRIRNPDRPPYIVQDHFYNRSGEYADSDMFRVSEELVESLTRFSVGYPYMGGRDESIRRFHPGNSEWFERQCKEKAELLHSNLIPGTHGWSSLYEYRHLAFWPIWCVSSGGGWSSAYIPDGICFKNPLGEEWVVKFDGTVFTKAEFDRSSEAERNRIFKKFHPKQKQA